MRTCASAKSLLTRRAALWCKAQCPERQREKYSQLIQYALFHFNYFLFLRNANGIKLYTNFSSYVSVCAYSVSLTRAFFSHPSSFDQSHLLGLFASFSFFALLQFIVTLYNQSIVSIGFSSLPLCSAGVEAELFFGLFFFLLLHILSIVSNLIVDIMTLHRTHTYISIHTVASISIWPNIKLNFTFIKIRVE